MEWFVRELLNSPVCQAVSQYHLSVCPSAIIIFLSICLWVSDSIEVLLQGNHTQVVKFDRGASIGPIQFWKKKSPQDWQMWRESSLSLKTHQSWLIVLLLWKCKAGLKS